MTVSEFYSVLNALYPVSLRCSWDNDGMMVCPEPERSVTRVMLALDATAPAIYAAAEAGGEVRLTHHPPIFRPLEGINNATLTGARVITALSQRVAVLSFHTRLDAAQKGVNDALVQALGLNADETFGDEETPDIGRVTSLAAPCSLKDFAEHVKTSLHAPAVRFTGNLPVKRIAIVGGSGKDFLHAALEAGADTFITGEIGYNAEIDAAENGLNVILAGHYYTEAPVLDSLAAICRGLGIESERYVSNTFQTV